MTYYKPNHAQMSTAVRGDDPNYRIGPRKPLWRGYAILIGIVLIAIFGTIALVAGVAK